MEELKTYLGAIAFTALLFTFFYLIMLITTN